MSMHNLWTTPSIVCLILAGPAQSKLTCMHSTHDNNRGGKGRWGIVPYHWDIWLNDQQSCPYMPFRSCISPSHTNLVGLTWQAVSERKPYKTHIC